MPGLQESIHKPISSTIRAAPGVLDTLICLAVE